MQEWLRTKWRNWEVLFRRSRAPNFTPLFSTSPHFFGLNFEAVTSGWSSYSWKVTYTFQKRSILCNLNHPKKGGAARSAQNCHTVQRLPGGFLLLPWKGWSCNMFFFLGEVSSSFVYPVTFFGGFSDPKSQPHLCGHDPPCISGISGLLLTHKSRESMPHLQFHANNGSLRKTSWICYRKVLLDSKSFLFPGIFEIVIFIQNLGGFDKKAWPKKWNKKPEAALENLRLWFCWRRDSGIGGGSNM